MTERDEAPSALERVRADLTSDLRPANPNGS